MKYYYQDNMPKRHNNGNKESIHFYERLLKDLKDEALVWRVSYELGGQRFYIPKKVKDNHFLLRYGKDFYNWIISNHGGETIIFPCGMNSIYKRNNIQAGILAERCYSSNEISSRLGMHHRTSQRAKKRVRDRLQINFFDYLK